MPAGRLPVYTVNNEEEAKLLITIACETNLKGEHIARELAMEQTSENLEAFSDRLDDVYWRFVAKESE